MKYILTPKDSINYALNKCVAGDVIFLKSGIYHEKIEVHVDNISIIGESCDSTIITNKDYFYKLLSDYNECNTFRSYTLLIGGNNISLSNITIENSSTPAQKYGQAVALSVIGNNFNCQNCIIKSAQDTLFTGPMPIDIFERYSNTPYPKYLLSSQTSKQIYKNCTIKGNVDFIFGGAVALFEQCNIIIIDEKKNHDNFLAAPSHDKDLPFGYLFNKCNIECESETAKTYLARPWRDFGCAAFIDCKLSNNISPLGFNKWNHTDRDKTARFYEYTQNTDLANREKWVHELNKEEAEKYVSSFLKYLERQD